MGAVSVSLSRGALALSLAVALAAGFGAASPAHASALLSSGYGQVGMEPLEGQVGTAVLVSISLSFGAPTAYILRASRSGSATPCEKAPPLPGAAPVIINDQGGRGKFIWPAALGPGQYALCAMPQTGTGPTAYSQQVFTVLDPNAPTPTVAPAPAVQAVLPATGTVPGTPFDVTLSNWPGDIQPEAAWLVAQRKPVQGEMAPADERLTVELSPPQVSGGYTLQTQVPNDVTAGIYAVMVVGFGVSILSNAFAVVAPAVPVQSLPPSASTLPTGLLEVLVAGLLFIVVGTLVRGAARQRFARGRVKRGQGTSEHEA